MVGAEGLAILAVVVIGAVGIGHINADMRAGGKAVAGGVYDRVSVDLHEDVVVVGGICGAGVVLHHHIALEVELAGVNRLDRAAVDVGNNVAGNFKVVGEGGLILNIDRAAAHRLAVGDGADSFILDNFA